MFDDFVRFGARVRAWHPAVSNGLAFVSYRQLDREVDQVGRALAAAGLPGPGAVIGVEARDGYRHALLTLACARLGLGTASLLPGAAAARMAALAGVDAVLSDNPATLTAGSPPLLDDAWFTAALTAPATPLPSAPRDLHAIARVQLSSGTTGVPKAVAITWEEEARRSTSTAISHGSAARALSLIGPESGGFGAWAAAWRLLGTALIAPPDVAQLLQLLPVLAPTTLAASPVQIAALLAALPPDYMPPQDTMVVTVAGGRLGRRQREQLALRLGARVALLYGSTEAGWIAAGMDASLGDERDVGFVMPGATVEIVDAADRPLPPGEAGRVRIAGPGVVKGYRDGPGEAFRDGWFYPGDLGLVTAGGGLRILGRADELINVGGEKFAPEALEEPVREVPGVADVAAFGLEEAGGADQPWLAIVRGDGLDEAAIGRALALPGLGTVKIAWIDAIPRTPMGKPRREELRAAARRLAG